MIKSVRARRESGMRFQITTSSGHSLAIDDAEGDSAPRPAELLLAAQAGCTALDVASILAKKHQAATRYEVVVTGEQREDRHPHIYRRIDVIHELEGSHLDEVAVRRAIELAATRYCTATAMLSSGVAEVHHGYRIRRGHGLPEVRGDVVVTGPGDDPDALGQRLLGAAGAAGVGDGS